MPTNRISIRELAHLPGRAAFSVSRHRDRVAYFSNHTGRWELYVLSLTDHDVQALTHGEAPRALTAGVLWGSDDHHLYFVRDEKGNEHNNIFSVPMNQDRIRQLNNDPDTQEYVVDAFDDHHSLLASSTRNGQVNLFRFVPDSGRWIQLTHFANPVEGGIISPRGRSIAFAANESPNLANVDSYVMDADGANLRRAVSVADGSTDEVLDWHPDERHLLVLSDATGAGRLGVADLETGSIEWIETPPGEISAGEFSQDGRSIVALHNYHSEVRPLVISYPEGTVRTLQLPPGVAASAQFALNDTALVIYYAGASRRGELVLYDLSSDQIDVILPAEYGTIDPAVFVGNTHITYLSSDGSAVPAILYAPADISPGAKLPAVIDVHGGPTYQYFRSFNAIAQVLVDRGYVVLQPNFRGSTGYGKAWREANRMDWGGGDLEDVAAGRAYLEQLGYVDPDRVAIFGGSYGGYMSYMAAAKKPDLFKVAIPWVGITDLRLLYEEDMVHFQYLLRTMLGDPQENEALWRDRSAITFADQVKAKLLIVHGVNDPRCPIAQARNFRDALIAGGNTNFEYIELDEGHGSGGDPDGLEHMLTLVADFLAQNL